MFLQIFLKKNDTFLFVIDMLKAERQKGGKA